MNTRTIFDFSEYKAFLKYMFRRSGTRGALSRAAEASKCQTSYLSRVMNADLHLTPDHGFLLCKHWKMGAAGREHFLTLLEHDRAADPGYRNYLRGRLADQKRAHDSVSERMQRPAALSVPGQEAVYFSSWEWSAIHFLTSAPRYQTSGAIALRLGLKEAVVLRVLEGLEEWGLVARSGPQWKYARGEFHLPRYSPFVIQHNLNWRMRSLLNCQIHNGDGIHFTSVQTIGLADWPELKQLTFQFIEKCKELMGPSPAEEAVALTCDLFKV